MTTQQKKQKPESVNKSRAEKPISLHGPKFEDVLAALLKTGPQPKEKKQKKNGK